MFKKLKKKFVFLIKYCYYRNELYYLQNQMVVSPFLENTEIKKIILRSIYYKSMTKGIKKTIPVNNYHLSNLNTYYLIKEIK